METVTPISPLDAHEFVRDLTIKGFTKKEIIGKLEEARMKDVLDFLEIQNAIEKGKLMRGMLPQHGTHTLPRIVGAVAILLGLGILILFGASGSYSRHSPQGYAVVAICLGLFLVIKPGRTRDQL